MQIAGARVVLNCTSCNRPNANAACQVDGDCIGGQPGACVPDTVGEAGGHCNVTACADQIFIGSTNQTCSQDSDCPEQIPGQCFTSLSSTTGYCQSPLNSVGVYEMATSNYIAAGGSGFWMLKENTSKFNTQIAQRDALTDFIREGKPCGYSASNTTAEGLMPCSTDNDCNQGDNSGYVCACPGTSTEQNNGGVFACITQGQCNPSAGRCVLQTCRDQVAQFHDKLCGADNVPTPSTSSILACSQQLGSCQMAGEACKLLACVNEASGAISDGRVQMVGQ
jgi:5'-nucleotidase